tara:strand:+ start:23583 stop:24200 length:618 start_codon:yes stop_codon:yes gene_type:complete
MSDKPTKNKPVTLMWANNLHKEKFDPLRKLKAQTKVTQSGFTTAESTEYAPSATRVVPTQNTIKGDVSIQTDTDTNLTVVKDALLTDISKEVFGIFNAKINENTAEFDFIVEPSDSTSPTAHLLIDYAGERTLYKFRLNEDNIEIDTKTARASLIKLAMVVEMSSRDENEIIKYKSDYDILSCYEDLSTTFQQMFSELHFKRIKP